MSEWNNEWWRNTSTHMWRTYFALVKNGFSWNALTPPNKRIYAICNHLFVKRFSPDEQDILRMFFTTRYGSDYREAVNIYSAERNIPVNRIWIVVKRANRIVMEECGFLDRKETSDAKT